jgi:hypothetical protein
MPEHHVEAGKVDEAEEIIDVIFPSGDKAAEVVQPCKEPLDFPAPAVLTFFIAGLLYLLCFKHVDNLGAYSIPSETGLLIPSVNSSYVLSVLRRCRISEPRWRLYAVHTPSPLAVSAFFVIACPQPT